MHAHPTNYSRSTEASNAVTHALDSCLSSGGLVALVTRPCLERRRWALEKSRYSAHISSASSQGPIVSCTSDSFVPLTLLDMPGGPRPPLEVIATWPPANLVNPEGRGTVTSIIAGVLSPITFFVVFARLWVRFRLQRNAGWDDWLMIAALVCPLLLYKVSHPLTLQKPFVAGLAILIPYSKIMHCFSLTSRLISHSCRQISQRGAYMGCRSDLVHNSKEAHLDH
jgi:hypothetical protein